MSQQASVARLIHNTGFNLSATILARLAHVILFIVVSRLAGPEAGGILTIGLTYLIVVGRFAAWGLDQLLIRETARDLSQTGRYLVNFLFLRLILAAGVAIILGGGFFFLKPYRPEVTWLIYLITLNILPEGVFTLCQAVFMAYERMEFVTLTGALVGGLKLLLGGIALALGFGITGVAYSLLMANLLATIATWMLLFRRFGPWQSGLDFQFCQVQLKIAAPFVLIAGAFIIDNQLDTLMLSWQVGEAEVGLYGAATTLMAGFAYLPQAYRDAVFPALSSAFSSNLEAWRRLYRQSYKYLLLMAIPITLGLAMLAEPILIWIFGPYFAAATPALQLLAFSVGLLFLAVLHNRLLIVANRQGQMAYFLAIGLLLNVVLNLTFVPQIGITGAALARLASNLIVFGLTYYAVFRQLYAFDARATWSRPLLAGVLMVVAIWLLGGPVWLRIIVGATVYGGVLLVLRTFSYGEIIAWLRIFKLDRWTRQLF